MAKQKHFLVSRVIQPELPTDPQTGKPLTGPPFGCLLGLPRGQLKVRDDEVTSRQKFLMAGKIKENRADGQKFS